MPAGEKNSPLAKWSLRHEGLIDAPDRIRSLKIARVKISMAVQQIIGDSINWQIQFGQSLNKL